MIRKKIKEYGDLYEISNTGLVFSMGNGNSTNPNFNKERPLKIRKKSNGYMEVKLFLNGKRKYFLVHRLVALTFIDNPNKYSQVNHINGIKTDNRVENLEWCTAKMNIQHSIKTGLQVNKKSFDSICSKQVVQLSLNGEFIKLWGSINEVKRILNYNSVGIINCCKNKPRYNTAYGYKWKYNV
jgi:hypothetical protein